MNKPYIPECDSPILLVNRAALNAISLGGTLYQDNTPTMSLNSRNVFDIPLSSIYKMLNDRSDIERYVVRHGDYEDYLFLLAPCNHCIYCVTKRQNDLVFRASMEAACYDCPPYFFTLTYKPDCLPWHGELQYKDVQDFFKRLRRSWDRQGVSHNIRYLVAGEYGSKSRRHLPHYHIIMFNNPYKASEGIPELHRRLYGDIFNAWGKMEPQAFDFSQCRGGAASYVTKYVAKVDRPMYGHYTRPFVRMSTGNGGLGSRLIDANIEYLRSNSTCRELVYRDFAGTLQRVNFGTYITGRVWPSPTRTIPPHITKAYRLLDDAMHVLALFGHVSVQAYRDTMEILRPYKTILPTRYRQPKGIPPSPPCPTALRLFLSRVDKIASDQVEILSVCEDIDPEYLKIYYLYKKTAPAQIKRDLGFASMSKRERLVLQKMKEKL